MLLLTGPTRRPRDVGVSLRAPSGCRRAAAAMEAVALEMRCPPPVALRVHACILHSGRYDCRVSAGVALVLAASSARLAAFGGTMTITD